MPGVEFKVEKGGSLQNIPLARKLQIKYAHLAISDNIHIYFTAGAGGTEIILENSLPARHSLSQNYPDSLSPQTWIPFSLATKANAVIDIYSLSGQLIRTCDRTRGV